MFNRSSELYIPYASLLVAVKWRVTMKVVQPVSLQRNSCATYNLVIRNLFPPNIERYYRDQKLSCAPSLLYFCYCSTRERPHEADLQRLTVRYMWMTTKKNKHAMVEMLQISHFQCTGVKTAAIFACNTFCRETATDLP